MKYQAFRAFAAKDAPQVGFDYIYRKISYSLSYLLFLVKMSPNQVSVASILSALVGGGLIVFGHPIAGMGAFIFSYLLDFCDGNIARMLQRSEESRRHNSTLGQLLENVNTNISLFSLLFSFACFFYSEYGSIVPVFFSFAVFACKMITRYTKLHETLIAELDEGYRKTMNVPTAGWKTDLKLFLTKGVFSFNFYYPVFFVVFVFSAPFALPLFYVYFTIDAIYTAARFLKSFKWSVEPQRLF